MYLYVVYLRFKFDWGPKFLYANLAIFLGVLAGIFAYIV